MLQQRVHRCLVAVDQVQHARGQLQRFHQLEGALHRQRNFFRRLQNESISAGDRVGQKPEGNHRRKIERRDRRRHSQRLPNHHLVNAGRHVLQVVSLHQRGNPAGDFHVLNRAPQFRARFAHRLPVFLRADLRQFLDVVFQQLLQLEQILNAVFGRRAAPRRISGSRGSHCGAHVFLSGAIGARASFSPVAGFTTSRYSADLDRPPCSLIVMRSVREAGHVDYPSRATRAPGPEIMLTIDNRAFLCHSLKAVRQIQCPKGVCTVLRLAEEKT